MNVQEAFESLKPIEVVKADITDTEYVRQGDIFAVSTTYTVGELKAMGAKVAKRGQLLGTNHVASETAILPDGRTFARGCLYHAPSGRRPDHARRKMGDGKAWHEVHQNTVVRSFDSSVRAWTISGRID
jgi:hypothetical protein